MLNASTPGPQAQAAGLGGSDLAHAPPTHVALLERSRAIEIAALGDDRAATHRQLGRLRDELREHIRCERDAVEALPLFTRRVVSESQRNLLRYVDLVLESSVDHGSCDCLQCTISIVHLLVRQARLESNIQAEAARRAAPRRPTR